MAITLLPRVRVNYTFTDLIKSIFITENSTWYRDKCIQMLSSYYHEAVALVPSSRSAIYELLIRLPQNKVVIPAYTCMVVNEAVLLSGKEIVFSSSEENVFNSEYLNEIDSDSIVIATHQYGLPCNIEEIARKCKDVGAILIEDCATSMGTKVSGRLTGTFGDYAIISLNASKTLTVPPFGGILIGKDREMINAIECQYEPSNLNFKLRALLRGFAFVLTKNIYIYKLFHWLTIDRKRKLQRTEHEHPSTNKTEYYRYQFAEWQAYILFRQLKEKDAIFAKRKRIYEFYNTHISSPYIIKPLYNSESVCTRYAVLSENRKQFYRFCISKGIDLDFSHCFIGAPESFKSAHLLANKVVNLPFYYRLTDKEMKKVVNVVNSYK